MDINDGKHANLDVIVCDDSALMRNMISKIVNGAPGMNVVATANNGKALLDMITDGGKKPDAILLDIEMPVMTGVEFLKERKARKINIPVVILSSIATEGAAVTMQCLELGAADFITKPGGSSISLKVGDVSEEIIEKVASYGGSYARRNGKFIPFADVILKLVKMQQAENFVAKKKGEETKVVSADKGAPSVHKQFTGTISTVFNEGKEKKQPTTIKEKRPGGRIKLIAIGISTGGPNALREVFKMIDPHLTQPILVVQHMPAGFTSDFASSLDRICPLKVEEAHDNEKIEDGHVYIAPGNYHIKVEERFGGNVIRTTSDAQRNGHRPSADVLFESVAKIYKNNALGVIMTGMGNDGAAQITKMREEGAYTLGQDEDSSIVYGMPKVAFELGGVQKQVKLREMADEISKLARDHK